MLSFAKEVSTEFFKLMVRQAIEYRDELKQLKAKHLPPYFLAIGASLIIGLLSFGGMLALWPLLPLAFAAFALSVVYEGEIYAQNIKGTFKKLFKANYLERQLAKECLLDDYQYTSGKDCPQFFKEYDKLCAILDRFQHKPLDAASEKRKKQVEKKLSDMEKWFAIQLFYQGSRENETEYQKSVRDWVKRQHVGQSESLASKWSRIKTTQSRKFSGVKAFCVIAAMMMGAGTSYLLVGAFMVVPFLAVLPVAIWPMLIAPMAILAGAAYGLLVYNAITDMISNKLLLTWYHKIRENFKQGNRVRGSLIVLGLTMFFALTVMLSICTAGTWWTVAKTTPALFQVFKKLPGFIMLVINPLVSSVSILLFNVQNISDTSEQIDEATKGIDNPWVWLSAWMLMQVREIFADFQELRANENWFQILNLIRIVIGISYTPLRFLAFLGHILSIGVTSDRVAGVSPFMSGALGAVNEGVEDVHYFVGHEGAGTCDLVLSNEIPNAQNLHKLKMISKSAYVLVKGSEGSHCLYYVNKAAESAEKRFISIKINQDNLAKLASDLTATNKARMLSTRQVKQIAALLPEHALHDHDPLSLRRERLSGKHGHTHEVDIPTQILDIIFWPLHRLAALWDSQFSRLSEAEDHVVTYDKAVDKQLGRVVKENVQFEKHVCSNDEASAQSVNKTNNIFMPKSKKLSESKIKLPWEIEHAIYLIDRHKEKYLKNVWFGRAVAQSRSEVLTRLQSELIEDFSKKPDAPIYSQILGRVSFANASTANNTHRFFFNNHPGQKTDTNRFLEKLSDRVARIG